MNTHDSPSDVEVTYRACAMLDDLEKILRASLQAETDPTERMRLEMMIESIPNACLLLGIAAGGRRPDSALRQRGRSNRNAR